jgi:predicted RNA-binding Zn ribbon-like protein
VDRIRTAADLETVRAFLNTVDLEAGTDALSEPAGLARWLVEAELAVEPPEVGDADLQRARRLRAALRDLARSHHDAVDDPHATHELSQLADDLDVAVAFTPDGGLELTSHADGPTRLLGHLVAAVAAGTTDGTWQRTKLCGDDACAWAFHDASRNRSGRWCSMAVCGNRAKARSFRARHD